MYIQRRTHIQTPLIHAYMIVYTYIHMYIYIYIYIHALWAPMCSASEAAAMIEKQITTEWSKSGQGHQN